MLLLLGSQDTRYGHVVLGKIVQNNAHGFGFDFQRFHHGLGHGHDQFFSLFQRSPFVQVDMNNWH